MSVDSVHDPIVKLTKSGNPRKAKRVDANGKALRRFILVVSEENEKAILEAVAANSGTEFVKNYVFETGSKEEFLGTAIAEVCKDWLED